MDKLYAIQEVFISVQSALDEVASYGERIKKWVKVKNVMLATFAGMFLKENWGVGGGVESDSKTAGITQSCYIHLCFYFGKQHSLYVVEG